eukprot:CAMPEP_0196580774 /NCGR_PEP_ID=MMETSP1081-20130531/30537_1 /TAXON_ID=36882 /ORGANISM="Pyramimonas amylifera, Strain CCMP720" /LENGTH=125 /DNA_ID=CAMNT_0041900755 /DNA_START=82 /DNA_END=456 /DNA_ORIENTATION=-
MSSTKKKLKRSEQSLLIFIQALQGQTVVVELHNDIVMKGKLDSVDDSMNLTLSDALCETPEGDRSQLGLVWIKGSKLRYVHMSNTLEVDATVDKYRTMLRKASTKVYTEETRHLNLKETQNIEPS